MRLIELLSKTTFLLWMIFNWRKNETVQDKP